MLYRKKIPIDIIDNIFIFVKNNNLHNCLEKLLYHRNNYNKDNFIKDHCHFYKYILSKIKFLNRNKLYLL